GGGVAISASLCPFDRREKSHSTMVIDFSHTFEMTRFFCLFYFGQTHRAAPALRVLSFKLSLSRPYFNEKIKEVPDERSE
ncbi:MAG: hypothetical protein IJZ22_04520, partial [Bacteroidaceae bacterium]|nr:hypothetical protein [Bacteroidaceae bacterium]